MATASTPVVLTTVAHFHTSTTIVSHHFHSKSQAIKAQFVTAIAAVLGVSVGLLARRSETAEGMYRLFAMCGASDCIAITAVRALCGIDQ